MFHASLKSSKFLNAKPKKKKCLLDLVVFLNKNRLNDRNYFIELCSYTRIWLDITGRMFFKYCSCK